MLTPDQITKLLENDIYVGQLSWYCERELSSTVEKFLTETTLTYEQITALIDKVSKFYREDKTFEFVKEPSNQPLEDLYEKYKEEKENIEVDEIIKNIQFTDSKQQIEAKKITKCMLLQLLVGSKALNNENESDQLRIISKAYNEFADFIESQNRPQNIDERVFNVSKKIIVNSLRTNVKHLFPAVQPIQHFLNMRYGKEKGDSLLNEFGQILKPNDFSSLIRTFKTHIEVIIKNLTLLLRRSGLIDSQFQFVIDKINKYKTHYSSLFESINSNNHGDVMRYFDNFDNIELEYWFLLVGDEFTKTQLDYENKEQIPLVTAAQNIANPNDYTNAKQLVTTLINFPLLDNIEKTMTSIGLFNDLESMRIASKNFEERLNSISQSDLEKRINNVKGFKEIFNNVEGFKTIFKEANEQLSKIRELKYNINQLQQQAQKKALTEEVDEKFVEAKKNISTIWNFGLQITVPSSSSLQSSCSDIVNRWSYSNRKSIILELLELSGIFQDKQRLKVFVDTCSANNPSIDKNFDRNQFVQILIAFPELNRIFDKIAHQGDFSTITATEAKFLLQESTGPAYDEFFRRFRKEFDARLIELGLLPSLTYDRTKGGFQEKFRPLFQNQHNETQISTGQGSKAASITSITRLQLSAGSSSHPTNDNNFTESSPLLQRPTSSLFSSSSSSSLPIVTEESTEQRKTRKACGCFPFRW